MEERRDPEAAGPYSTLLEINNAIISNLTQESLFHAISEALRKVVPFDRALLYVALAGPIPSLVRAAVSEVLRALAVDRALDPLQSLALAALAPLLVAPGWAGDLGFQLSCAATAGLTTWWSPTCSTATAPPTTC